MHLSHLQIVNFKNLKQTHFKFCEGTNTIIGENDSGKSNAMQALRILLDDSYYYNTKRLKDSDFSYDLDDWKGHWIIISAMFSGINEEEQKREVCAEISPEVENLDFLNKYIKHGDDNFGVITLFIRPQKSIRKRLNKCSDLEEFNKVRNEIRLTDYEFYYTSRSQVDYTDPEIYKSIIGDFGSAQASNPDDDDSKILGTKLNITDVQDHISVVCIDALRDVAYEMNKPKNPIRRIVESIESTIKDTDLEEIKENIKILNSSISNVEQVGEMGDKLTNKLVNMIGMVYSPEILIESELDDDLKKLSRYLSMKPANKGELEQLGLGHLNMIYMALKMVEFEFNRNRELLNIMIIEEPEAHIHKHIQKTLFENLKIAKDYTQVIMTTHSAFLSEASGISCMSIMKQRENVTTVISPINGLDKFGEDNLKIKNLKLTDCIERYLDVKRSPLLFSKAVILVEGDGEEILIPNMIKEVFGIVLDELGISIINVGSTSFEYVASLFHDDRIRRHCAIITDLDKQVVEDGSTHYKASAETRGQNRKDKLKRLFDDNNWVDTFYAESTLEIEFADGNLDYIEEIIKNHYVDEATKEKHLAALKSSKAEQATTILTLANGIGKGWYAVLLANQIDCTVNIPEYILDALSFACQEVLNMDILLTMLKKSINDYDEPEKNKDMQTLLNQELSQEQKCKIVNIFTERYKDDPLTIFINFMKSRVDWLGGEHE